MYLFRVFWFKLPIPIYFLSNTVVTVTIFEVKSF